MLTASQNDVKTVHCLIAPGESNIVSCQQHAKNRKQIRKKPLKSSLADAQESPIGRYRILSETDIDAVYSHEPHNSLIQA